MWKQDRQQLSAVCEAKAECADWMGEAPLDLSVDLVDGDEGKRASVYVRHY